MSFADQIKRCPLPYDVDRGAEAAALFGAAANDMQDVLRGAAGCSPYLAGLIAKEVDWLRDGLNLSAEDLRDQTLAKIERLDLADLKPGFRQAKRRIALLAALADLGGVWPLEQVTGALSDLSDRCLDHGLRLLVAQAIARSKLPGLVPDDVQSCGGMVILAMGKTGARELNYSSDIDLICLFDETRFQPDDYAEARAGFVKITRALMSIMSEVTADGYVFRTDLRLRPDASVTPVCVAMEAAERYYESVGRTWERAAFIKARACAGDIVAGDAFLVRLTPFVWRRHLDFAAIQDAHDMRLLIRGHKGLGEKIRLEGHNMKLGPGGIREIEFFTQTRQIIAGGREPSLRVRGTLEGLARLSDGGWIEPQIAGELGAQYRNHREIEHRLQMINDAQTHDLPETEPDFDRFARFCGSDDTRAFRADLFERLSTVAQITEAFFAPDEADETGEVESAPDYLTKWRSYPALRSPRAVEIFTRLFPGILKQLQAAARPDEALQAFEKFLSGLPSGVQLFSLFEANPTLTELIADICALSPDLAEYLSRNARVFDAVIVGDFFAPWPGLETLSNDLETYLDQVADYEAKLDALRGWQKEWHFRIGVHQMRAIITSAQAAGQYADLAEAVVAVLARIVAAEFSGKHGPPPGSGAAVIAMGSLGAGRLTAQSDLDLIVIYDADNIDSSYGPRPLLSRAYYARQTQALITALTAPMSQGRLYETDMRLRPSGQAGPVAVSIESFDNYQRNEAWVWEHLALTQARVITGDPDLRTRIETVRKAVLMAPKDAGHICKETVEMRARLHQADGKLTDVNIKRGPGGRRDLALFAQSMGLLSQSCERSINAQLEAGRAGGWLSSDEEKALKRINGLYQIMVQTIALLAKSPQSFDDFGSGGQALLLRDTGHQDMDDLKDALSACRKQALSTIETVLNRHLGDDRLET